MWQPPQESRRLTGARLASRGHLGHRTQLLRPVFDLPVQKVSRKEPVERLPICKFRQGPVGIALPAARLADAMVCLQRSSERDPQEGSMAPEGSWGALQKL